MKITLYQYYGGFKDNYDKSVFSSAKSFIKYIAKDSCRYERNFFGANIIIPPTKADKDIGKELKAARQDYYTVDKTTPDFDLWKECNLIKGSMTEKTAESKQFKCIIYKYFGVKLYEGRDEE